MKIWKGSSTDFILYSTEPEVVRTLSKMELTYNGYKQINLFS